MTREEAIDHMLRPIQWNWSSSIRGRQNLVCERHKVVADAYPLFTPEEQARANTWFEAERHAGLWD